MKKDLSNVVDCIIDALVRVNDDDRFGDILERLRECKVDAGTKASAPKKAPAERKRDDDKYYYDGINVYDLPESERFACNSITVCKGYRKVLQLWVDRSLKWLVEPCDGGLEVRRYLGKFNLGSSKMVCRGILKRLAKAGQDAFNKQYLPPDCWSKTEPQPCMSEESEDVAVSDEEDVEVLNPDVLPPELVPVEPKKKSGGRKASK